MGHPAPRPARIEARQRAVGNRRAAGRHAPPPGGDGVDTPGESAGWSDRSVATALGFLSLVLFAVAGRLRFVQKVIAGDEPHYLIFNIAMEKYHSLDVARVYQNKDYWSIYPAEITYHLVTGPGGLTVPLHSFGGPLLWHLPYLLWGRGGAMAVIVLVSVLTVVNIYYFLRELGIVRSYAGLVTALFAVGTPLYIFSSMLFIEPIGALAVIYAVRVLVRRELSGWRLAVASTGLGVIPWVQGRFALFTVIIGALLLWRVWRTVGRTSLAPYLLLVLPVGVLFGGLEVYNLVNFHTLSPAPGNASNGDAILQVPVYKGIFYIMLDRSYGLIPSHPIFVLVLPGILLTLRRKLLPVHLAILLPILPYLLGTATYREWWAGYSPAARFMVIFLPLLSYYVAVTLQRLHSWVVTGLAVTGAAFGFLLAIVGDVQPALRFHPTFKGNEAMEVLGGLVGWDLEGQLPNGLRPGDRELFLAWAIPLVLFGVLLWLLGRRTPSDRVPDPPVGTPDPPVQPPAQPAVGVVAAATETIPGVGGPLSVGRAVVPYGGEPRGT